ncbi:hypothetical protein RB200_08465 [Streptomyces sp. PmtG]
MPARRARKRQAFVGAAAVVLFAATAVPALVHVTRSSGDSDARPSIVGAGSNQHSQGGSSEGKGESKPHKGGKDEKDKKSDKKDKGKKDEKDKGGKGKDKKGESGATGGAEPGSEDTDAASSPACDASQLDAAGSVGPNEAGGRVYGTFRVANVSGSSCTVDSAGAVAATAQGAASPSDVNVVDHTAGDGSGLPDPALETSSLVLQPGAAYEVRFAWVPSAECPADGGEPTPNPSPSEGGGGAGGTGSEGASGETGGVTTQLLQEDGTKDGSVAVSLTPEPGAPSAGDDGLQRVLGDRVPDRGAPGAVAAPAGAGALRRGACALRRRAAAASARRPGPGRAPCRGRPPARAGTAGTT